MMETIAILFIFFILVFIGLIFFFRIMKSNVADEIEEAKELSAIEAAQIASSLPELQCSQNNIIESNCIDILKLENAVEVVNTTTYFDLFSYSRITVQQKYPLPYTNWTLYEKKPVNVTEVRPTYFPISLFDPKTQYYYFGVMIVDAYT